MKIFLTLTAIVLLQACTAAAPRAPAGTSAGADTCNAASYQGLIGQDQVVALSLPDPKRIYRLGDPVTMDFLPNRLNVKLDETDVIVAIDCG